MHWIKGINVIYIFQKFKDILQDIVYSKILDDMKIPDQLKRNLSQRYI